MRRATALVVDRDPAVRSLLAEAIGHHGGTALQAQDAPEALETLGEPGGGGSIALVFVELSSAIDVVLRRLRQIRPMPLLVGMTRDEVPPSDWRERGFDDILSKPLEPAWLSLAVSRTLREASLRLDGADDVADPCEFVGDSSVARRLRERLEAWARDDSPVWLHGEPGSGRRHAARYLHERKGQGASSFVALDCRRGELPGPGIAAATLYLEAPAALPRGRQGEILEALDALGRAAPRIVCGSTSDPAEDAREGRLDPQVVTRLGLRRLHLPSLVRRLEDLPQLARHFADRIAAVNGRGSIRLDDETVACLEGHRWPGNLRELRDAIEHAALMADDVMKPEHLPRSVLHVGLAERKFRSVKREVVDGFERRYLADLLRRHRGNVTSAAQGAGMLRSALQRLLRKHGLRSVDYRPGPPR